MTDFNRSSEHLWEQIVTHVALFYPARVVDLVRKMRVCFCPFGQAVGLRGPVIAIPTDLPAPEVPEKPYRVDFNGTWLTLWNPMPFPGGGDWSCEPNAQAPLWYRHESGTLLPAYNMYSNLWNLMTLDEERRSPERDRYGRFPSGASPRVGSGLLEVPAFNEAVAAVVAACLGLAETGRPALDLRDVRPMVSVVLSHDCDILLGNDVITQAVRALRIFLPVLRGRPPHLVNVWWILRNTVRPRASYHDNIAGIVDVERMAGFASTFYMLNGTWGRFGARSGSAAVREALKDIPEGWDVGMHYNFDTYLEREKFVKQKRELEAMCCRELSTGRAHYLRFDPARSWSFLADQGIQCDETLGYPDVVGYRGGIAGIFRPFDVVGGRAIDLWEVPLVTMDCALLGHHPKDPVGAIHRMIAHLRRIGGVFSVLFHPGVFFNPEFPEYFGVYRRILQLFRDQECRGETATSLMLRARSLARG